MRSIGSRIAIAVSALAGATAMATLALASPAMAGIPFGQAMTGKMTYYDNAGYGACGTQINAASEDLVAVSSQWWTSANPNNDPLCQGVYVQVSYSGKTVTVPVRDKCPSCDATHIDLSKTAFERFAPTSVGVVNGITWKFVTSSENSNPARTGQVTGQGGACVDVAQSNASNGTPIQIYHCNGTGAQKWTVGSDGTLRALDKCMDITGGSTASGTKIQLYDCNGTGAQVWNYTANRELINPQSNKCLDLPSGDSTDGNRLQIWDCNGAPAQKWSLP